VTFNDQHFCSSWFIDVDMIFILLFSAGHQILPSKSQSTVRGSEQSVILQQVSISPTFYAQLLPGLPFGLFWNCLPEKKWFGHLAFFNVDKSSIFQGFVWTNLSKFRTVYEIPNFYLVILTKIL
jgi:hypothetical protein